MKSSRARMKSMVVAVFMASHAWGDLTSPDYPSEALSHRLSGTVTVHVHFDSHGKVDSCKVLRSSGSGLLDETAVKWILNNWSDPKYAGTQSDIPIVFKVQKFKSD